jgi:hypothetical protein
MEIKEIKKLEKNFSKYFCKSCNFKCFQKCDWDRHIIRPKHIFSQNGNNEEIKKLEKTFLCDCGKNFKTNSGLWKHKKICISSTTTNTPQSKFDGMDKDEVIIMLLKQNADLIKGQQDMMKGQQDITMEIVKNGVNNINTNHSHNTTTNSHNKAFNLNLFLNETCKNAMNITDFIETIKLQLNDFMEIGKVGYVQGISNIIVKNLNSLDETLRPIHCTDQKRETFYVKDENRWEKEEEDKKKIKKMIKSIAFKNEKLIKTYKETYPDYNDPDSKHSDQYSKTVIEALGGIGDNEESKQEKIIKNISKVTSIKQK